MDESIKLMGVLGGLEGAKQSLLFALRSAPQDAYLAIAELLKYPGGSDWLKKLRQIDSCVAVVVAGDKTYRVYSFDAVAPAGHQACYWRAWASLPEVFDVFEAALVAARQFAQDSKLPLLFEVGHYCKAPAYVVPVDGAIQLSMLSDIYPVTAIGRRIKFASASHRSLKGFVLGEPDRVGWKRPYRRNEEWEIIKLWRCGEELSRGEVLVKNVLRLLADLERFPRLSSSYDPEEDRVSVQIDMVMERGWYNSQGELDDSILKPNEYESFDFTFEQAAVALPAIRAALTEIEIRPSRLSQYGDLH